MRLCTFEVKTHVGTHQRLGAMIDEGIVDLNFAAAWGFSQNRKSRPQKLADVVLPGNMLEFLQEGETAFSLAAEVLVCLQDSLKQGAIPKGSRGETLFYRASEVRLLAPLPNPTSMRDFYAFEDHVKKGFEKRGEAMPAEWYEMPVYYKGGHQSIIGPDHDVAWPSFTNKFDYELELAIVIGREGHNIKADRAGDHIAGYTVMNDFSARDIQRKEMKVRLGPAKGKDWCTAIGPVLVTSDEIADPYSLKMTARVNGELWSEGNSSALYWKFEQMLEFLSKDDSIYPGDLIGSGTVGTGCGLELDRWVQPGDIIELEIEKIGILRNKVVKE